MVFGGVEREHLQLNEETLWSGGPYDPVVKDASAALPQIRQLLFAGDIARAHDLFGRRMMGKPYEQMKYQPLGDLLLDFGNVSAVSDYRRELDLDRAVAQVTYRSGGVTYMREVFASAADQVLVMRLTADRPGRWRAGSVAVLLGTTVAAATPFLISHLSRVVCTATDCL